MLGYARPYLRYPILTVVGMFLLVGVQLLAPWLIRTMIAAVKDQVGGQDAEDLVTRLALLALGIYLVRGGLRFLRSYMWHVAGWGRVADARRHVYQHIQRLSLRFYEDKQTGSLMSRVANDTKMFERLIAQAVPDVSVSAFTLIGLSVTLARLDWQLLALSMIPVLPLVIAMRGFAKYVRPAFRERQKYLGDINATLNDNLSGIREIKAFTREEIEAGRVSHRIDRYRDSMLKALRLMATFRPFVEFSSSVGTIVLIYFGGRLVLGRVMPIEDLVAFFLYPDVFCQSMRTLGGAWEHVQEALAGAECVVELLQELPHVRENGPRPFLSQPGSGRYRYPRCWLLQLPRGHGS